MPKNVQYAIAGVVLVGVIWVIFDSYNNITEPSRQTEESIREIDEALDRAQPGP